MKTHMILVSACALALATCSGAADTAESDANETAETNAGSGEQETVPEGEASDASEAEASAEAAATDTKIAAATLDAIPARFQGVWDAPNSACDGLSDGVLEIKPKELSFYESNGEVTLVVADGDAVRVTVSMAGEGEEWTETYVFSMAGDKLDTAVESAGGGSFKRKRCS